MNDASTKDERAETDARTNRRCCSKFDITVRQRLQVFALLGIALSFAAFWTSDCFAELARCENAEASSGLGFVLLMFGAILPAIQRWAWSTFECHKNAFYMRRWQRRCDGLLGGVFKWWLGINRDGTVRP